MIYLIVIASRFYFKSELILIERRLNLSHPLITFFFQKSTALRILIFSRQITNEFLLLQGPRLRLRYERSAIMKLLETHSKKGLAHWPNGEEPTAGKHFSQ